MIPKDVEEDLDAGQIGQDLESAEEMLDILAPLTAPEQEKT